MLVLSVALRNISMRAMILELDSVFESISTDLSLPGSHRSLLGAMMRGHFVFVYITFLMMFLSDHVSQPTRQGPLSLFGALEKLMVTGWFRQGR